MGSSSSSPSPAQQPANGSSHGSKLHSKLSSSFGAADPVATFQNSLRKWADEEKIPGFRKQLKYQVYEWRAGDLDHHSVVIGCESRTNAGYVTMELRTRVDEEKETVFPFTQYFCRSSGEEMIESKKWVLARTDPIEQLAAQLSKGIRAQFRADSVEDMRWNGEVETRMKSLMKLSINLIRNHGKYSEIANSCQHFVKRFVRQCANNSKENPSVFVNDGTAAEAASVLGGGFGGGALSGAVIGGLVGGPPGAAAGAYFGLHAGGLASMGAVSVARHANTDSAVHEVRLAKD